MDESVSSYESIDFDDIEVEDYRVDEHRKILFALRTNNMRRLDIIPYNPSPSVTDWRNLGQAIGINTSLECIVLCPDGLDDEDDIATTDNLEAFVRGFAQNRSLKELIIELYDFSRARLELIHPFIIENDNLRKLDLLDCGFGQHDLQLLALAFSRRRDPTSIRSLGIGGSNMDDESVPIIVEICGYCPRLQRLDLTYCRQTLRIQGWTHLATFLQDPKCSIKRLELAEDGLNDEGARVLASSLVNNKKLRTLRIFDGVSSSSITSIGWGYFLNVLGSTSNANTILDSNHSLQILWNPIYKMPDGLPEELIFCLKVNEDKDKKKVIRRKIFHYHLNGNEKLPSLIGTDQEILPNLLDWIGKDYNICLYDDMIIRKTAFYRIIRSYPDLCNFESYDRKMRRQLEVENATIKAELANLKAENKELRQKIEQLTIGK